MPDASDTPVVVYGAHYSVYTRIARLALEEKDVAYALEEVDIFAEAGPPPNYLERQPFARIPAFSNGDFSLYEAGAITRYVDEAFDGPALQPTEPEARARMNQIMSILDSYGFKTLVWDVFFERVRVPVKGGVPDEARISTGVETAHKILQAIETIRKGSNWLVGDSLTLADLHAYPMVTLFRVATEGESCLQAYPALVDWHERLGQRESAERTRHPLEMTGS